MYSRTVRSQLIVLHKSLNRIGQKTSVIATIAKHAISHPYAVARLSVFIKNDLVVRNVIFFLRCNAMHCIHSSFSFSSCHCFSLLAFLCMFVIFLLKLRHGPVHFCTFAVPNHHHHYLLSNANVNNNIFFVFFHQSRERNSDFFHSKICFAPVVLPFQRRKWNKGWRKMSNRASKWERTYLFKRFDTKWQMA